MKMKKSLWILKKIIIDVPKINMLYTNKNNTCNNLFPDKKMLKNKTNTNFIFFNVDITKRINIDKKYDIIYTSNIWEYIFEEDLTGFMKEK